jgi:ABC-type glycerol-3-phosphate transport system substrate-binding protein
MGETSRRRRAILRAAVALAPGALLPRYACAQPFDLGPYLQAKINWRQAEGENIAVAVTPAGYFDNLVAVTPQFEALTGVKVRFDRIPPTEIRQKAIADLAAKSGTYATSATDPMYYALYASREWVDPLDTYLGDSSLTDAAWFRYDDLLRAWREGNSVGGKPYAIPFDGEVTLQIYRKDLYDAKGLKPAETLGEYLRNARAMHDPPRVWGAAMRGLAGAGQNMYIFPSIFRSFGGQWFAGRRIRVNSAEAIGALDWYVHALTRYAPPGVASWNWPDLANSFAAGTLAAYVDAHSTASVLNDPGKSRVIGKIGYARWPKGPSGKRVTAIGNWGLPVNAALSARAKRATWLFISWAASEETQARTSWKFPGAAKRTGLNRLSLWRHPAFVDLMKANGHNLVEVALESLERDTDVDWRPRVPQWPAIGEAMAAAVHAALTRQKGSKQALDEAQVRIERIMKG